MDVHPLIFEPIYKPKLWGGQRIFTFLNRPPMSGETIGESWELVDLEEDQSRVVDGPARGKTLGQLVEEWGLGLVGNVPLMDGRFPLMIKFLDAVQSLSVQVHPDETMARKLGGNVRVKHESWYVLLSEAGGVIYHGLKPGTTAEQFKLASLTGNVEEVLRKIPVRPGECYYLPSGTPHALGAGVLVAEVQTPSDITYRTYDWGRVEPKTGQPRELHLDQAIECIDFDHPPSLARQDVQEMQTIWSRMERLLTCPCFTIDRVEAEENMQNTIKGDLPVVWIVLDGRGHIEWRGGKLEFGKGNVMLLPAGLKEANISIYESGYWLEVNVPERPPAA
jgi:mannose-6-phosphate isomerase